MHLMCVLPVYKSDLVFDRSAGGAEVWAFFGVIFPDYSPYGTYDLAVGGLDLVDISISDDTWMYRHNLFCSSSIYYMLIISDNSDFSSFLMTQVVLLISI